MDATPTLSAPAVDPSVPAPRSAEVKSAAPRRVPRGPAPTRPVAAAPAGEPRGPQPVTPPATTTPRGPRSHGGPIVQAPRGSRPDVTAPGEAATRATAATPNATPAIGQASSPGAASSGASVPRVVVPSPTPLSHGARRVAPSPSAAAPPLATAPTAPPEPSARSRASARPEPGNLVPSRLGIGIDHGDVVSPPAPAPDPSPGAPLVSLEPAASMPPETGLRPTPQPMAAVPLAPRVPERRITIGRIDVEVHNEAPPPEPVATRSSEPSVPRIGLASRFLLKP